MPALKAWRLVMVSVSFAVFGLGAVILGCVVFPLLGAFVDEERSQRRCRRAIQLGFRVFVVFLTVVRLLRYDIRGNTQLLNRRGVLVIANHPSLIDAIMLVSHMPDVYCVVKGGVWRNPFYGRVVRAAGYVPSLAATEVVERVTSLVRDGETVLLFPEGTRTAAGELPRVRRGAALILLRSSRPAVPVRLHMSPTVLTKGYSLWRFPTERVQYSLTVGDAIRPELFATTKSERVNAREGAKLLERMLGGEESILFRSSGG